jgi:tRNA(Ile2) C34 agmatinyltransferase TiaS
MRTFFKKLIERIWPTITCACGGRYHEEITWGEAYYSCPKCKRKIDEEEFWHRHELKHRGP